MRVRLPQGRPGNPAQFQHPDLSSAENIADSIALLREEIALLREENDRLRKMAESLSTETEQIRRSLSPAASLMAASHLKAFLGLS